MTYPLPHNPRAEQGGKGSGGGGGVSDSCPCSLGEAAAPTYRGQAGARKESRLAFTETV